VKKFIVELKRRRLLQTLLAYVAFAWLVLQIVGVMGSMIPVDPLLGKITLLILVCALPVAAFLSWHFDVTTQGIKRTPSLEEESGNNIQPFGTKNWLLLALLVTVCSFIGSQYFTVIKSQYLAAQSRLAAIQKADSIAVLPFVDQSAQKDQGYLALGVSEEITSLLGRSDGFRVMASRSSQILVEKGFSPIEIGQRLDVATVLTGTVQATGQRLKIRVELIDSASGNTLWTESFMRELKDVFSIESEIGRTVVNLLQDKYLAAGDLTSLSATSSTDAYVLYLKGREAYRKQTTESMQAARKLFEQAVALDPEYAKGYVGLADTLVLLAEGGTRFGVLKTDIAATLAQQNIDKALSRQPQMAEAYAVQGYIYFMLDDFERALAEYAKAIELNPSLAIAYMWQSLTFNTLQQFDEAISAQQKAQALDPLFLTSTYNLGMLLSWRGRYDEAETMFKQLMLDFPDSTFPHEGLADMYFSRGDFVGAIREGKLAAELSPDNQDLAFKLLGPLSQLGLTDILRKKTSDPFWEATLLIFEKKYEELFKKMEFELAANPDDYWVAFEAGWYHALFGNRETAQQLLTEKLSLIDEADMYGMPYCSPAIEVAWAEKIVGNQVQAFNLISKCKALLNEQLDASIIYSELDYLSTRIYALEGKPEDAIKALSAAINKGWREWWTQYDPLLASLQNEPEFQTLIAFLEQDLTQQRSEAQKLFEESP
jgi:TolB-like protein/tetratricopeptide (TPR) repeat protein